MCHCIIQGTQTFFKTTGSLSTSPNHFTKRGGSFRTNEKARKSLSEGSLMCADTRAVSEAANHFWRRQLTVELHSRFSQTISEEHIPFPDSKKLSGAQEMFNSRPHCFSKWHTLVPSSKVASRATFRSRRRYIIIKSASIKCYSDRSPAEAGNDS